MTLICCSPLFCVRDELEPLGSCRYLLCLVKSLDKRFVTSKLLAVRLLLQVLSTAPDTSKPVMDFIAVASISEFRISWKKEAIPVSRG